MPSITGVAARVKFFCRSTPWNGPDRGLFNTFNGPHFEFTHCHSEALSKAMSCFLVDKSTN